MEPENKPANFLDIIGFKINHFETHLRAFNALPTSTVSNIEAIAWEDWNVKLDPGILYVNILNDLQFAIISGEHYLCKLPAIIEIKNKINSSIKGALITEAIEKLNSIDPINIQQQINYLNKILSKQDFEEIIKLLELFYNLSDNVQLSSDPDVEKLYYTSTFEELINIDVLKTSQPQRSDISLLLFKVNIKLAEIEDNLKSNHEFSGSLYIIEHFLNRVKNIISPQESLLYKLLKEKCIYLLKKLKLRSSSLDIVEDNSHKFNAEDNADTGESEFEYLKYFNEQTELHYKKKPGKITLEEMKPFLDKLNKNEKGLGFTPLHHLAKFFRQHCGEASDKGIDAKKGIDKVINYFKIHHSHYLNGINFNRFAYKFALEFFQNTKLRILVDYYDKVEIDDVIKNKKLKHIDPVEQLKRSYADIERYFDEITTSDAPDGHTNKSRCYYAYSLICQHYCNILVHLESVMKDTDSDNTIKAMGNEYILDIINKFSDNFYFAEQRFKLLELKGYYPIYLPVKECEVPCELPEDDFNIRILKTFNILMESSYILPISYEDMKQQMDDLGKKFFGTRDYLLQKITSNESKNVSKNLQEEAKEIKKEIRISEKQQTSNYIQILAIFAAILTFAFGSIKVLPDLKSINAIIAFMVGFAAALAIFVSLLHYVISALMDDHKRTFSQFVNDVRGIGDKGEGIRWGRAFIFICYIVIEIAAFVIIKCYNRGDDINTSDSNQIKITNTAVATPNAQNQAATDSFQKEKAVHNTPVSKTK